MAITARTLLAERSHDALRGVLLTSTGELPNCDFKLEWTEGSKLARHVLGMANSGGGAIVVGVDQDADGSLHPTGLATFTDETKIRSRIYKFIPDGLNDAVSVSNFGFSNEDTEELVAGKQFQVLFIADDPLHLPFVALRDGKDIRNGAVYTRRGTSTVEASHDEIQRIINRRLATGYSTRAEIDLATVGTFEHY